jgi:hypothetical protein
MILRYRASPALSARVAADTKLYNRRLVPLIAAHHPPASPELRAVLAVIIRHVDDYAARAQLPRAA